MKKLSLNEARTYKLPKEIDKVRIVPKLDRIFKYILIAFLPKGTYLSPMGLLSLPKSSKINILNNLRAGYKEVVMLTKRTTRAISIGKAFSWAADYPRQESKKLKHAIKYMEYIVRKGHDCQIRSDKWIQSLKRLRKETDGEVT